MTPPRLLRWGGTPAHDVQPQLVRELHDLIRETELLQDAVWAKDKRKASEAIVILVPQFISAIGHDDDLMREVLQSLGRLRNLVVTNEFQAAEALVVAWLARLRLTSAVLAGALRK